MRTTPLGQVLIVSNNVYEAESPDFRRTGDMRNFVEETLKHSPYAPDVVLVQELRAKAAANIRDILSGKTGHKYAIATNAGKSPWHWVRKNKIVRGIDCAVIFNTDTMRKVSGGHILTKHAVTAGNGWQPIQQKQHSWARLVERGSASAGRAPLRLSTVSLHFPRQSNFKNLDVAHRYKREWSNQISRFLSNKYPDDPSTLADMNVIAGDFNDNRCLRAGVPTATCGFTPFYDLLVRDRNYKDSVFEMTGKGNPIDFIFSSGNVSDAWWDQYNPHKPSAPGFYSNHDLRWALVEGPDATNPTFAGNIYKGYTTAEGEPVIQGWRKSFDGGSGFAHFEVQRRSLLGGEGDWVRAGQTRDNVFKNTGIELDRKGEGLEYRVRAVDNRGNAGRWTDVCRVVRGSTNALC